MAKATMEDARLGRFNAGTRESRVWRLLSLRDGICQQMEGSTCQSHNTRCSFAGCSIKVFVNNKKFGWQTPLIMDISYDDC